MNNYEKYYKKNQEYESRTNIKNNNHEYINK